MIDFGLLVLVNCFVDVVAGLTVFVLVKVLENEIVVVMIGLLVVVVCLAEVVVTVLIVIGLAVLVIEVDLTEVVVKVLDKEIVDGLPIVVVDLVGCLAAAVVA